MRNVIGQPVFGDNFLFRDKKLRTALRLAQNGNSFLMLGIRRTGKSSFIRQVAYWLKEDSSQNICIELDCSACQNPLDFYKELYDAMPKSLQDRFKKVLMSSQQLPQRAIKYFTQFLQTVSVGKIKIELRDQLMAYSKPFENTISEFFQETPNVYLFLDELPFFFENIGQDEHAINEIKMILTSLRGWRNAGLAMGITGSLNLHLQLEHIGISRKLLAGLNTLRLDPFSKEESEALFNRLLENNNYDWWTPAITESILQLIPDYIPYFLQYAFNAIVVQECKTAKDVEEVYHNEIFTGLFTDFIYQFDDRLKAFKKEDLQVARAILDAIAKNEGSTLNDLQTSIGENFNYEVLTKLIDQEFITISGAQTYRFTLNIIKNWWVQKQGLHAAPMP